MPVKKASAGIVRLLVVTVAAEPEHGCRIVRRRIVVGDRTADRAAIAHLRIADAAGQIRQRGNGARTSAERSTSACRVIAPTVTTLPLPP